MVMLRLRMRTVRGQSRSQEHASAPWCQRCAVRISTSQDAAGDRGDIGVAGPTSDGESVRHLNQMSVRVGELVFGIHHCILLQVLGRARRWLRSAPGSMLWPSRYVHLESPLLASCLISAPRAG